MYDELRRELLAMAEQDQRVRHLASQRAGPRGEVPDDLAREWTRVDAANTARLTQIVAAHGWPTRSLVGDEGANAAWLLAQHADQDPAGQRRFLDLLRAAVAAGEASPMDLAYLTDRVAVHAGQPQAYGTQLCRDPGGRLTAHEITDPDAVDQRRAALGLCPLADYIATAGGGIVLDDAAPATITTGSRNGAVGGVEGARTRGSRGDSNPGG